MCRIPLAASLCLLTYLLLLVPTSSAAKVVYVDPRLGNDRNSGTQDHPLKSISAAVSRLPDPVDESVEIHLASADYVSTGAKDMPGDQLILMRRMRPEVQVSIIGASEGGARARLDWQNSPLVYATEGNWSLENLQIANNSTKQRRGIMVEGPAHVTLKDVTIRTRSHSDAAIYADRGGKVSLRGQININDDLFDRAPDESFAGIIATDHALVQFVEREGASLQMGNGSLSASYYGVIRLGCEKARITSWTDQGNTLAINNGGRIDLHNTETTLCAKQRRNTPIGLEHDGHILGEGAHVIIVGENENAIVLQKASTFTCNDIELKGHFNCAVSAMSSSMFVGRLIGDVTGIAATTGACVNVEQCSGEIKGSVSATRAGVVSLPDRIVSSQ
jgi:hypothetical protein